MGAMADIQGKSSKELREKLSTLRRDLVKCVFESSSSGSGPRKDVIRKEIARILTVLSLRKIRGDDV